MSQSKITISQQSDQTTREKTISITIENAETYQIEFIGEMKLADFAKAITGSGWMPIEREM